MLPLAEPRPPCSLANACELHGLQASQALVGARRLQGQADAVRGVPGRVWCGRVCAVVWQPRSPVKLMASSGAALDAMEHVVRYQTPQVWRGLDTEGKGTEGPRILKVKVDKGTGHLNY